MTYLLLGCYVVAVVAELGGIWVVVMDIRSDATDLRAMVKHQNSATASGIELNGGTVGGQLGAFMAQHAQRASAVEEFVVQRLEHSFSRRWAGLGLILIGTILGAAGNIVSLFA